jgi:hypothetical protein
VSLAAFILALFGVLLAAVPLAVWGIVRTKRHQRRGRGMAITALGISAAWAIASAALVVYGLGNIPDQGPVANNVPTVTTSTPTAPVTTPDARRTASAAPATPPATPNPAFLRPKRVFWENLKPTMCVRVPPNTATTDLTVVDCRSPHQVEVMARTALAGPKKWPGDTAMDDALTTKCKPLFASYIGVAYDDSQLDLNYITADTTGWNQGDHTVICVAFDPNTTDLTHALHDAHK